MFPQMERINISYHRCHPFTYAITTWGDADGHTVSQLEASYKGEGWTTIAMATTHLALRDIVAKRLRALRTIPTPNQLT